MRESKVWASEVELEMVSLWARWRRRRVVVIALEVVVGCGGVVVEETVGGDEVEGRNKGCDEWWRMSNWCRSHLRRWSWAFVVVREPEVRGRHEKAWQSVEKERALEGGRLGRHVSGSTRLVKTSTNEEIDENVWVVAADFLRVMYTLERKISR
jgi:hypothetical protein